MPSSVKDRLAWLGVLGISGILLTPKSVSNDRACRPNPIRVRNFGVQSRAQLRRVLKGRCLRKRHAAKRPQCVTVEKPTTGVPSYATACRKAASRRLKGPRLKFRRKVQAFFLLQKGWRRKSSRRLTPRSSYWFSKSRPQKRKPRQSSYSKWLSQIADPLKEELAARRELGVGAEKEGAKEKASQTQ